MLVWFLLIHIVGMAVTMMITLPYPKGIRNPKDYYGRYRREYYASKYPFYQWWYFWVIGPSGEHYTVTYLISGCSKETKTYQACKEETEGVYVMFGRVTGDENNVQKVVKFGINDFVNHDKDSIKITVNGTFSVEALGEGEYQIYGKIDPKLHTVWMETGPKDVLDEIIEWNVTISRHHGWYGQHIVEDIFEWLKVGVIMWNTYSHTSKIRNGFINIGNETVSLSGCDGYCDSNWGTKLPIDPSHSGKKDFDYSWGWFIAKDLSQDFVFVCGIGQIYSGELLGTVGAKYCDILFGDEELSVRHAFIRNSEFLEEHAQSSTDGHCYSYQVQREDWVYYEDKFGNATFPLSQNLELVTEKYNVYANFSSKMENYNRILFPFDGNYFSDFEGLGVTVNVIIQEKKTGKIVKSLEMENGGIEFGFKYDVQLPKKDVKML